MCIALFLKQTAIIFLNRIDRFVAGMETQEVGTCFLNII